MINHDMSFFSLLEHFLVLAIALTVIAICLWQLYELYTALSLVKLEREKLNKLILADDQVKALEVAAVAAKRSEGYARLRRTLGWSLAPVDKRFADLSENYDQIGHKAIFITDQMKAGKTGREAFDVYINEFLDENQFLKES